MVDISIRKRGSMVHIFGVSVEGCGWIKTNMWVHINDDHHVIIQLEHLEHWLKEMDKADLAYEYY